MAITVPSFPEDRGPIKVDPLTGSTLADEVSYCKDLDGCGTKDFLVLSQSMSINECDTTICGKRFLASVSVNLTMRTANNSSDDVETLIDYIRDNLKAAYKACPEGGGNGGNGPEE
jgi:hypothetical protein